MMPNGVAKRNVTSILKRSYCNLSSLDNKFDIKQNCISEDKFNSLFITAYEMALEIFPSKNINSNHIQNEKDRFILSIQANSDYGLPYGLTPRLLLNIILNEILLTKSPVLRLGKIFIKLRQIHQESKLLDLKNHNKYLNDQMLRLFSSYISFTNKNTETGNVHNTFDFWWNPVKTNITASSTVVLTKDFYNELIKIQAQCGINALMMDCIEKTGN